MRKNIFISLKLLCLFFILLGFVYPAAMTATGYLFFREQTTGSLLKNSKGELIGSALLGQKFSEETLFHSRPSASDYGALPSSGSNLGPISKPLSALVKERIVALNPTSNFSVNDIPSDAVFASASGLDPHISLENAIFQAKRISEKLQLNLENSEKLDQLIKTFTEERGLGFLGKKKG